MKLRVLTYPVMVAGMLVMQPGNAANGIHESDRRAPDLPVLTPEVPKAYEPFRVDFTHLEAYHNFSIDIQIENKTVVLEHPSPPSGFLPPTVPVYTRVEGLPAGDYSIKVGRRKGPGDVNYVDETTFTVRETSPTTTAYTLFHPQRNRYFVTASPRQRDRSINNYGWQSADEGFNVWYPSNQAAPETAKPVCRFYSSEMNARYWTADQDECDSLKESDSGWNYQGIVFQALVPTAGVCPTGTDPVWRLYNGRQNDSNYRFVTSNETYRTMVNDGWEGEGVKFCSPPGPEEQEQEQDQSNDS